MSLRINVLYSLKWLAGARLAGQFLTWTITLVVIRILEPSDYGLMAIAALLIGFAALFQELGMYSAMVQKRDLTDRHVEQAFGFLILVNSFVYLLVFFLAPQVASFFDDPRLTDIVRVLGIQFPLASIGIVQDAILSRRMRFKQKSLANFVMMLVSSITTLIFAIAGAGVWALVWGSLAGSVIRPIALSIAANHWCWPKFSREGMGDMFHFGSFITASGFFWYVYSKADVFIIGKVLGNEILGVYSVAMQLAALPMQKIGESLNQVGLAAYSSIQNDMPAIRSHYLKVIRLLSFVAFPVFWGISSISPELVTLILGIRWERAIIPLQLLSIVMPIRMISHSGSPLTAIGKPQVGTLNHLVALIVMPPAFFIGAHYGGLTGVSLAWVIVYPLLTLIWLSFSLPPLGLKKRDYFRSIAGPAIGGAVMYVMVMLVREMIAQMTLGSGIGLALLIVVGMFAYSIFMWLFQRNECREIIALIR